MRYKKQNVTEVSVHIMMHATKQTKFAAYQGPRVQISQLSQPQYEKFIKKKRLVEDWNHMLRALNQSNCEDDTELEEFKQYAAKKLGLGQSLTL
jgi:hypothetical protein